MSYEDGALRKKGGIHCVYAYPLQREMWFHMGLQLSTRSEVHPTLSPDAKCEVYIFNCMVLCRSLFFNFPLFTRVSTHISANYFL